MSGGETVGAASAELATAPEVIEGTELAETAAAVVEVAEEAAIIGLEAAVTVEAAPIIVSIALTAMVIKRLYDLNEAIKKKTPPATPSVAPCPLESVATAVDETKEEKKRKRTKIYFITIGKKLTDVPVDFVAKEFFIKLKTDKYEGKFVPLRFEDSKSSEADYVARSSGIGKEAKWRSAKRSYYVEVDRLRKLYRYSFKPQNVTNIRGRQMRDGSIVNLGESVRLDALCTPDGRLVTSDVDILAIFDPEDDLGFAYPFAGHGTSTKRIKTLIRNLKNWSIEQGVEALRPNASYPMRDGIPYCNGNQHCPDGLSFCTNTDGTPRVCKSSLSIKGKWYLYSVQVESDGDNITKLFRIPQLERELASEADVVKVFNSRTYNPSRVRPNDAWKWKWNSVEEIWEPSQEYSVPENPPHVFEFVIPEAPETDQ
ncbi:MAG TPA: hypothetical protein VFW28_10185 [Micropepsaceae bacterium]|nr:hypothetical protein [Micropepsaceae bacterium]